MFIVHQFFILVFLVLEKNQPRFFKSGVSIKSERKREEREEREGGGRRERERKRRERENKSLTWHELSTTIP